MLQVVAYPTYALVGEKEFVPYHISFGKRMLSVTIFPMVIAALSTFILVFIRPDGAPLWASLIAAAASATILGTTMAMEVPKHMKLDKEGKSIELIQGLVRDNIPRSISWVVASLALLYMAIENFG